MQAYGLIAVAACLLAQHAAAVTLTAQQGKNVPELAAAAPHPVAAADSAPAPDGGAAAPAHPPATLPRHAADLNSTVMGSMLSWFGGEAYTIRNVTDTFQIPQTEFMNLHRHKIVQKPYIEIQRSVPAFTSDQQRSLLHFTLAGAAREDNVVVTSAKLTLKRLSSGEDYGWECPSKVVRVSRVFPPDSQGAEDPHVVGGSVSATFSDNQLSCDVTGIFNDGTAAIDYRDFWLMLESDPMCYFSFESSSVSSYVTVQINKSIKEKVAQSYHVMMMPLSIVGVILLGGAIYFYKNRQTDYIYFQDHGDVIVNA
ncbi:cytochrome oxidase subunit I, putative [Babesia caballi]|uniref:Cytochrome oxidase subunit I, putative n=1 Tax=Babesia caballi TaxID=5871 RepID=A0AAV4LYF1_BABCB|nr:cytochrome oxidase subunit I, putative [Babesia caballi]